MSSKGGFCGTCAAKSSQRSTNSPVFSADKMPGAKLWEALFALFSRYMIKALMQILIFNFQKMRRLILNKQRENRIHLEFQKCNAGVQELLSGQIILIPNLNGACFL